MTSDRPPRPVVQLPVSGRGAPGGPAPPRHETILSVDPDDAGDALRAALELADVSARREALLRCAAAHPAHIESWARLSELSLAQGHGVVAYACARVAYHRGLDRLRREGWGGTGMVRWARPSNRGFLRGLHALLAAAAALDEPDEAARCRGFLLELDPDDAIGVAEYPEVPGPDWKSPPLP